MSTHKGTHMDCIHFISGIRACDILAHNMDMRGHITALNPTDEGCYRFEEKEKKKEGILLLKTPVRELKESQLKWFRNY